MVDTLATAVQPSNRGDDAMTGSEPPRPPPDAGSSPASVSAARRGIRIAAKIHSVARMRRKTFDQMMKPHGVTRAQWWVLALLSRHDGMMQTQLADVLQVGKSSVGALIERLEAAKLVERQPDPIDKRGKRVYLTRAAHQLVKRMIDEENRFNRQMLSRLTADEGDQLIRLLDNIETAITKMVPIEPAQEPERR